MSNPETTLTILQWLNQEAGIVAGFLFISNLVWFIIYWHEKKERQAAWKSHTALMAETIQTNSLIASSINNLANNLEN